MTNRWFDVAVVLFWLATMSWLLASKVLPPLVIGEPPSYRTILEDQRGDEEEVSWEMFWNDRRAGWARTTTERQPDDITEILSQVHFFDLPLEEMVPFGLGAFVNLWNDSPGQLTLDARNGVEIDPLGRLIGFRSNIRLGGWDDIITMQGTVEGARLQVKVRSGEFTYTDEIYLSSNALVGDTLSPQARLPHLRIGQTWTVPVYSPFRAPNQPMEVLEARVEREEPFLWNNQTIRARVVVYRSDEGAAKSLSRTPRGLVWVHANGDVLQQEIAIFASKLRFMRLADGQEPRREAKARGRARPVAGERGS